MNFIEEYIQELKEYIELLLEVESINLEYNNKISRERK